MQSMPLSASTRISNTTKKKTRSSVDVPPQAKKEMQTQNEESQQTVTWRSKG